jgi:hypothetical protein
MNRARHIASGLLLMMVLAVTLAEKATNLAPKEPDAWLTLGLARYRAGDVKGTIDAMKDCRTGEARIRSTVLNSGVQRWTADECRSDPSSPSSDS